MKINEIMQYLPHRYPFLLIDRVIEVNQAEGAITAQKNVTINEPFFNGHFPGSPIMPGVLVVEAMAQAGGILGLKLLEAEGRDIKNCVIFFMTIDKTKFRVPVVPGDTVIFKVQMTKRKGHICQLEARAYVDDELVCESSLKAMIKADAG
ncbi:3-hydroxyacyl-ACP dehydratase FabZ [Desulfurispira natronophila]|uniref:3-hydroxyacyl-[acyl-carrier-protein] dehydratase FabZ n=1 Tax=Desulfurispira natronophila TaxID=682562 RepID=A0A7W8DGQ7_9BACT|nr:3-hydroxyacyl-ACP dehydratase FabZ [Desulfurispira natronophila]MBB5021675.1 3-hydroxyacyl-[acyl-carrier-protein] dehydratase [Desulfurispira natronophila]